MKKYQIIIENAIKRQILSFGCKTPIRNACEYALLSGGKRLRPSLSLMIANALNMHSDVIVASLAVEYFHTASLIADDLPCMDNDDMRRNKPAIHKLKGEAIALLTTYALIAEGYRCLWKNSDLIAQANLPFSSESHHICTLALENATYNTGLQGATGGQFMDIAPQDLSLNTIKEIIHKKTTALFEISFVIGWLYGGGQPSKLDLVKVAAKHFGLAFQIADDIGDMQQDMINGRKVNVANLFGLNTTEKLLEEEVASYHSALNQLEIATPELIESAHFLADFTEHHEH